MRANHILKTILCFGIAILLALGSLSHVVAQDEDDTDPSVLTISDLSNTFDFKKLGGMQTRLTAHGNNLMGDMIDKNTGGISFSHTDVSIPGNSDLEVALRRKISQGAIPFTPFQHGFGDWVVDIPLAYATFGYDPNQYNVPPLFDDGCLVELRGLEQGISVSSGQASGYADPDTHTEGTVLHIPGKGLSGFQGNFETPSDPKTNWKSAPRSTDYADRCATVVIAPDGTEYKFGRHTFRTAKDRLLPVEFFTNSPFQEYLNRAEVPINRQHAVYLITEVKDIHGNWVRYEYTNDSRAELTRIFSNDGREIQLNYEGPVPSNYSRNSRRISNITTNNRMWTYDYVQYPGTESFIKNLHKVNMPDGRHWRLGNNTHGMRGMIYEPHKGYKCVPYDVTFDMKHPDGSIGTFRLRETRHIKGAADLGWSGDAHDHWMVPMDIANYTNNNECNGTSIAEPAHYRPGGWPVYQAMSVASKTISGNGLPTAQWNFEYRNYSGGSLDETWTKVTEPDGTERTYTYQAVGQNHGLLKKIDVTPVSGNGETIDYEYDLTQSYPVGTCWAGGSFGDSSGMCVVYNYRPVTKVIRQRDGDTYTTEKEFHKAGDGYFQDYGYPNVIRTFSSVEGSETPREQTLTYEHNLTKWILNLPKTVTINDELKNTFVYYPNNGKLKEFWEYGFKLATLEYFTTNTGANSENYAAGNPRKLTDALGRISEVLKWKRGHPVEVKQAVGTAEEITWSQTVDDNGWTTSRTDARGNTTSYDYADDDSGLLKTITPSNTIIGRSPSKFYYTFGNEAVTQRIDKGYERNTIKYDLMLRPIEEYTIARHIGLGPDGQVVPPKVSITTTRYDALGRPEFKSLPYATVGETIGNGTDYTYDAFGRVLTAISSIDSAVSTTYRYLDKNCIEVKDGEDNITTTCRDGYSGPGEGNIVKITQEEGIITTLSYNDFGELEKVAQSGSASDQEYFYNDEHRLCRYRTPEAGDTLYTYDDAGQMTSYAKGIAVSGHDYSGNGCFDDLSNAETLVNLTYDNLGRLKKTEFADPDTPDIWRDYDPDGNITHVLRGQNTKLYDNNGNNVCLPTAVCWFYGHDEHNRIKFEELQVDEIPFETKYYYNYYGYMTRKVLPTGRQILMANDALGRTLTVGWSNNIQANGFKYHPNGQLARFNYGNDHVYISNQNDLQQTDRTYIQNPDNGVWAFDQTYSYDKNGRILSQTDGINASNSRTYTYDGLGRLDTAFSDQWGLASYDYDAMGNLKEKIFDDWNGTGTTRTVTNAYDTASNRIASSTDSANISYGFDYDARGNVTATGQLGFTYDLADQPTSMNGTAPNTGTVVNGSYVYDGNLKRVKSIVNGITRYNVYDLSGKLIHVEELDNPLTTDVDESSQTDYLNAAGMTLARIKDNVFTYMHSDHLGSPAAGTDEDGNIVFTERYTPYGEALVNPAANDNQSGFTGHIKDADTGLNYMQARYYDPNVGRFLSIDPVTFLDTGNPNFFNRYTYAFNDPINVIDPTGMAGCSDTGSQGLSGTCYDSSNFRTEDKKGFLGTKKANDFSNDAVGTASTDAAASDFANSTNQTTGNEQVSRIDTNPDGTSSTSNVPLTDSGPSHAAFKPSEVAGADGVIHTHPTDANTIVPGAGDSAVPEMGIPNYIAHGTSVIAVEISGGQVRGRVVSGKIGSDDRRGLRSRLNEFQRRGKTR